MASTLQFDTWQSAAGANRNVAIQTKVTYSTTKIAWSTNSSWIELSTDYRVTITPTYSNSVMVVNYYLPMNIYWSGGSNCLHVFRAFRSVGGTKSYALSSAGGQVGSARYPVAGHMFRPPGYDYNDGQSENITAIDLPGTTNPVTYGFEMLQEASNAPTNYMGYSASDNSTWGFSSTIVIVAQEIAQ